MPRAMIVTSVLLVLVAGGCSPGEDGGENATFVAVDIDFEQAPDRLDAGEVTIELVNDGELPHNVTFEGVGAEPVVSADGGDSATGSVTLEPGEQVAYCSVPGHREAGMEVTVTVEG